MHQPSCTSYHVVTDTQQAATLLEPKTLLILSPFVSRPRSAREAAELTGVKLTTLLYQLKRLVALGILEYKTVARAGRAIKRYHATQQAFFVPYRISPYATAEDYLWREYEAVERSLLTNLLEAIEARLPDPSPDSFGLWVMPSRTGGLKVRHGLHPEHVVSEALGSTTVEPLMSVWDDALYLDEAEALELSRQMLELFRTYQAKRGDKRYFVRMAFTPVAP
jgi:hypothetical protein